MSEDNENLQKKLESLHRELQGTDAVDPELNEPLQKVLEDIRQVLEGQSEQRGLRDRVSDLALNFETDHPTLAETLNKVTHVLASLGI